VRIIGASETMAIFDQDGGARLFHNNVQKFTTTATGVDITGGVKADGLDVLVDADDRVVITHLNGDALINSLSSSYAAYQPLLINGSDFRVLTGASERLRVDASGNVLVGTTTDYNMKHVIAGVGSATTTGTGSYAVASIYDTSSQAAGKGGGLAFQGNDGVNTGITYATINGAKENSTSGNYASYLGFSTRVNSGVVTERMRIDSSGNVGIGVIPKAWHSEWDVLDIGIGGSLASNATGTSTRTFVTDNAYNAGGSHSTTWKRKISAKTSQHEQIDGKHVFRVSATGAANSAVSWNDAVTINNSSHLLVGITSSVAAGSEGIELRGDSGYINTGRNTTSAAGHLQFYNPNGVVGSILTSGSATSYNTSSDYRLKTNVLPMTGATATFMQLKPCNFEWIADGTRVDGFLAHELGEVIPAAATGTHNGMMDEEYEATAATGDIYTAATVEVATESQVMETVEAGSYVNLAGETIVETEERGVTTDLVETVVQRQDVDGVSTEVEVEVTTKVPTMETVITTPAVSEVIHSSDVEQPETLEEGQAWRETTPAVMATRSVPDYQGVDQSKVVPLITATIQELIARIEALEAE